MTEPNLNATSKFPWGAKWGWGWGGIKMPHGGNRALSPTLYGRNSSHSSERQGGETAPVKLPSHFAMVRLYSTLRQSCNNLTLLPTLHIDTHCILHTHTTHTIHTYTHTHTHTHTGTHTQTHTHTHTHTHTYTHTYTLHGSLNFTHQDLPPKVFTTIGDVHDTREEGP